MNIIQTNNVQKRPYQTQNNHHHGKGGGGVKAYPWVTIDSNLDSNPCLQHNNLHIFRYTCTYITDVKSIVKII